MSETNERRKTVADIVAVLRDAGKSNIEGDLDWTSEEVGQRFLDFADEIEAAAKRMEEQHKREIDRIVLNKDFVDGLAYCAEAAKRELSKKRPESGGKLGQFGNAAAMREALEEVTRFGESDLRSLGKLANRAIDMDIYGGGILLALLEAVSKAKTVLEIPPRQCDVGTAEEQSERFYDFCQLNEKNYCGDCPFWDSGTTGHNCELRWAQMPYKAKEGAGK